MTAVQKDHYDLEDLLACGRGDLFGSGNAQLPAPPMLMMDRITKIASSGGKHGKGLIEAERALVLAGNAVSIDGWVRYEPRLKGTVDAVKRTLTSANRLMMGITALKELKLSRDAFAWQCIDDDMSGDGGDTPTPAPALTGINSPEQESPGIEWDSGIEMHGTGLALGSGDKVEAKLEGDPSAQWHDLTGYVDGESSGAELIVLGGDAWEVLSRDVDLDADHTSARFRVTTGGGSAEIVATALVP